MPIIGNFDALWLDPRYAVFVTRKELMEFVKKNSSLFGHVMIAVKGNPRYVKWKSAGAGLYKVWTEENE